MRPCGGFSPDMMNFANSTNVYKIWADMIAFDKSDYPHGEHAFCGFCGLRDSKSHALTHDEIMAKYGSSMKMVERIPEALSGAMGNMMYVANFPTEEELWSFYKTLTASSKEELEKLSDEKAEADVKAEETVETEVPVTVDEPKAEAPKAATAAKTTKAKTTRKTTKRTSRAKK